jgi:hypothetical protein
VRAADLPDGTIASLGHPANGVVARKIDGVWWRFPLHPDHATQRVMVALDDERALQPLWTPGAY